MLTFEVASCEMAIAGFSSDLQNPTLFNDAIAI